MTPRAALPLARATPFLTSWDHHYSRTESAAFYHARFDLAALGYTLSHGDAEQGGVWLSRGGLSQWYPGWHPAYLSVASGDGALERLERGER